jgi:hypothetical protein
MQTKTKHSSLQAGRRREKQGEVGIFWLVHGYQGGLQIAQYIQTEKIL